MMTPHNPKQGEIWSVTFDPTIGREIQKNRPAVVISNDSIGKLPLRIVVPITHWQSRYSNYPWFVLIESSKESGLIKDSGVDDFQIKSLSIQRFTQYLGVVKQDHLKAISSAIMLCISYN